MGACRPCCPEEVLPAADGGDAGRPQQLSQAGALAPVLGVPAQGQVRQGRQRGAPTQRPAAEPCEHFSACGVIS